MLQYNLAVFVEIVIYENAEFGGEVFELYRDLEDATSMQLSDVISVRVIRGWYGSSC